MANKLKAVFGYHYPTGKWHVLDIMFGPLSVGADTYSRCQIDKLCFTSFIEAPVKSISTKSVQTEDGFNFPEVLTLEQSIINTKKSLRIYLGI